MPTAPLLRLLAAVGAGGFALTYAVALHTGWGLHADAALYRRVSGNPSFPVTTAGERALATIDVGTVAAVALLLAFLALARGRVARAGAAVFVVASSVASAELVKHGLPHVAHGLPVGRPPTFPSGHTSVAVSLGLALLIAVPRVARPVAALVGAAYAAGIAVSVVVLGWHYPSDTVGSFFLCTFWAAVAGLALRDVPSRPRLSRAGVALALGAVAVGLVIAVAIAQRHPAAVELVRSRRALLATAAALGLVSVCVFAAFTPLVDERAP